MVIYLKLVTVSIQLDGMPNILGKMGTGTKFHIIIQCQYLPSEFSVESYYHYVG